MKRLIVTDLPWKGKQCRVVAQVVNNKLWSLSVAKGENELLGSIHVGKVQKVLPNIQGAFVEIENHLPCYLPLSRKTNLIFVGKEKKSPELKAGDEILVQVTQEALKLKAPSVSGNLSFTGRYLVLTTGNKKLGISGKIPSEKREGLRVFMETLLPCDRDFGVVVRTNASRALPEEIAEEYRILLEEKENTLKKGSYSLPFTCIKEGDSLLLEELKGLDWEEMEKIVTDIPQIYQQICSFKKQRNIKADCLVELYQDALLPLYKVYSLECGLEEALWEKVWLRSGGFLVIQQTEAFVSIDVNSGKYSSKKMPEDFFWKMNVEAAEEIVRQIQLRNLYGIILIDFINMKSQENRAELIHLMKKLVKADHIKTTVVDVTALGIMEVTRQKEKKSLKEQLQDIIG